MLPCVALIRNDASACEGLAKVASLLKMPAETEPPAFRTPLTVTVRSAALAAVSAKTDNVAATTEFRIIFASPDHAPADSAACRAAPRNCRWDLRHPASVSAAGPLPSSDR